MEDVLRERRRRTVRITALLAVCALALLGVYLLRDIFTPLIFGFLFAYALEPLATWLQKWGRFSRFWSVIVIFSFAASITVLVLFTAGYYATQTVFGAYESIVGENWIEETADYRTVDEPVPGVHFEDRDQDGEFDWGYLRRIAFQIEELVPDAWDWVKANLEYQRNDPSGYLNPARYGDREKLETTFRELARFSHLLGFGEGTGEAGTDAEGEAQGSGFRLYMLFSWFVLCPLYVFFFMLELNSILDAIRRNLPGLYRDRIIRIFSKIDLTLSAFLRGRLLVCLTKGGLTAFGLLLLGVPFWLPLGLAAGFLSLIPYVGIWFAIIPALILSWVDHGSLGRLIGVAAVFGSLEVLEGLVLVPAFLGKEVGLHPLTIVVTLLIFGRLFGFIGVLLSVPLAAITKILAEEFILPLIRSLAEEKPPPPESSAEP